jgi:tetratricopeptide (TPR) repeat protein
VVVLTWLALKEYEKALIDFSHALELDPNDVVVYNNRGLSYAGLQV